MKTHRINSRAVPATLLAGALLAFTAAAALHAQAPPAKPDPAAPAVDPTHAAHPAAVTPAVPVGKGNAKPSRDVARLQAKVARLEAALAKKAPPMAAAGAAMPGMSGGTAPAPGMIGMMDKMMPMGGGGAKPAAAPMAGGAPPMMDDDAMEMPPMGGGAMPPAPAPMMDDDMMKMAAMMGTSGGGMAAMPQSALPGFPGASHLYHLGATDFFLDHQTHIALTTEQTAALNQAKEKAALAKSTADRAIEQAEQELWTLTAADQPDTAAIEAKTAEIGKLSGAVRLDFIRAVGEASKLLTEQQRKSLTGFAPPAPALPAPAAPAAMAPMQDM